MEIEFENIGGASYVTGSGAASLRYLHSYGAILDAGNSNAFVMRSVSTGTIKDHTSGSGTVPFRMYATGFDTLNNGVGYGFAFASDGFSFLDIVPQYALGSASISAFSSEALVNTPTSAIGSASIPAVYGFSTDVAGDYAIAYFPGFSSVSNPTESTVSAYITAIQPSVVSVFASTALVELEDALTTSDAHTLDFIYGIVDRAFSLDSLLSASRTASLLDSGSFQDRVQRVLEVATTDGLTLTDDVVDNVIKIVALIDAVRLSDNNIPWRAAAAAVADTLTALSVAVSVADGDITDAATVAEALDARRLAMLHLVDAVSVDAAALGLGVISLTLDDSLDIAGDVLTHTTFIAALTESLNVAVSLTLDGIPYVGFCMNTSLKAVTEFGAYDFNSLAHLRGRMYGARDDGLYLLEGPDDAGAAINASLRTALTRIAGGKQAHVDSAYLGYSSDGQVQIKVITTEATGSKTSRVYQLNPQIAVTNRAGRIKIGKGVKSAYWAFEITNVLGEDFTIDVLELHVLALSRRV